MVRLGGRGVLLGHSKHSNTPSRHTQGIPAHCAADNSRILRRHGHHAGIVGREFVSSEKCEVCRCGKGHIWNFYGDGLCGGPVVGEFDVVCVVGL